MCIIMGLDFRRSDSTAEVPSSWEDSDPCYIDSSHEVRLRSFTTKVIRQNQSSVFHIHVLPLHLSILSFCGRFTKWTRWCRTETLRTRSNSVHPIIVKIKEVEGNQRRKSQNDLLYMLNRLSPNDNNRESPSNFT